MSDIRLLALSRLMAAYMNEGHEIYRPSLFWQNLNKIHEDKILADGFDNFKIGANLHYFNFLMFTLKDPHIARQISLWPTHLDDSVIETVFENKELFTTPESAEIYRIFVSLLWGFTKHNDTFGLFEGLSEPQLGNALRIKRKDAYISQDLCNSYREFQTVVTKSFNGELPNGRVIGELGAGYGRVGYVFGMLSNARYCFFDIPPALAIAQTYFLKLFPDKKIFGFRNFSDFSEVEAEIASSQFSFFTANQIALFPDSYFDTFINISSLHEMTRQQIGHYLNHFDRLTRVSIYLKQWISHKNEDDQVTITSADYSLPEHWQTVVDQADAVSPNFFERLLLRR